MSNRMGFCAGLATLSYTTPPTPDKGAYMSRSFSFSDRFFSAFGRGQGSGKRLISCRVWSPQPGTRNQDNMHIQANMAQFNKNGDVPCYSILMFNYM